MTWPTHYATGQVNSYYQHQAYQAGQIASGAYALQQQLWAPVVNQWRADMRQWLGDPNYEYVSYHQRALNGEFGTTTQVIHYGSEIVGSMLPPGMIAKGILDARRGDYGSAALNFGSAAFELGSLAKMVNSTAKIYNLVPDGQFYSVAYEVNLPSSLYPGKNHYKHFQEANKILDEAMTRNTDLAAMMEARGIKIPKGPSGTIRGYSPENWVWHHDQTPGVLQLVPKWQHPTTPGGIFWPTMHPNGVGGMSIWGN